MRKALIGVILAATALSSVAAEAQRGRGGDRVREQNESSDAGEARPDRAERRQQRERRGDNDGRRDRTGDGSRRGRGGDGGQTSVYPQAWQGDPNDPALRRYQRTEQRNQQRYDNDRRGDRDGNWRGRDGRTSWNRDWRRDRRYDWQNWRNSNRNVFRAGRYYSPYRNWGYSRFNIGIFLQPLFYGRNYWLSDPWQYRLPPAYPGTQWVRYYNDVLLVDVYTGEVLDVIYGFFW